MWVRQGQYRPLAASAQAAAQPAGRQPTKGRPMRWVVLAATTAIAATLWLPVEAAPPATPPASAGAISFEQYRDWRLNLIERRQSELAVELAGADLPAQQK